MLTQAVEAQLGAPSFASYDTYSVSSKAESVVVGDFNADGRNDVGVTTSHTFSPKFDFKLAVFLQQPDGLLSPTPIRFRTHAVFNDSMGAASADLNADGLADVVVCTSAGVDFFYQRGGVLRGGILVPTPTSARYAEVADVNGDARPDVIVQTWGGIYLLLNKGPSFAPFLLTANQEAEIEVADVNDDGLVDVVGYTGSTIHVYLQSKDGNWASPLSYLCAYTTCSSVAGIGVGDVTGDGRTDVVATIGCNEPGALLNVLEQLPAGGLALPVIHTSYQMPASVEVVDINADGRADVLTRHGTWMKVGVYFQDSQGLSQPEALYPMPYTGEINAKSLQAGDVSGDGLVDILLTSIDDGLVVLRQLPNP